MSKSNNNNSTNKYKKELENIEKKVENLKKILEDFKNPDSINIENNIDEEERNKFLDKIKDMVPHEIINNLASCGELQNDHDFMEINENDVKEQIGKLEKLKLYLIKEINTK
jgi:hypothetical protein